MKSKKVATQLMKLKNELATEREKSERLQEKVASLERRQQAENILIQAKDAGEAPSQLKPASVDDFLAKRASLEDQEDEYLEKVATMVEFTGDGDGLEIAGNIPGRAADDPKNLGNWILNN